MAKHCPQCRSATSSKAVNCPACGYWFSDEPPTYRWEQRMGPYFLIVVVLVLLVVLIGAIRKW
jgi:hypothetical protein